MTDSEIKYALYEMAAEYEDNFFNYVLDLINRQRVEIEGLTELNKVLETDIFNANMNLENLTQHIYEIREWEVKVKFFKKQIQCEAIEGFAERLKKTIDEKISDGIKKENPDLYIVSIIIDKLAKEMAGEKIATDLHIESIIGDLVTAKELDDIQKRFAERKIKIVLGG